MSRTGKNTDKLNRHDRIGMFFGMVFKIMLVFSLMLSCVSIFDMMSPESAFAGDSPNREGYVENFMSGVSAWNEQILGKVDPDAAKELSQTPEQYATTMVDRANTFAVNIGFIFAGFALVILVGRFAGRGIYEIAFYKSQDIGSTSASPPPKILLAASERKNGSVTIDHDNWFRNMAVETIKYTLFVCLLSVILGFITALVYGAFAAMSW